MTELAKRIDQVGDEFADEQYLERVAAGAENRKAMALMKMGGINAVNGLSIALSAQVMRALQECQDEKIHENFGYQRFADFLDNWPHSPMTKNQYYDRIKLLENEGDIVFNLLNDLNFPMYKRRLLGKGNIQLEGETVIVVDGEEETQIELNDRTRLLETLTALADRNYLQDRKIKKQAEGIDRLVEKTERLSEENERIAAMKSADLENSHAVALLQVSSSFVALKDEIERLTDAEREAFAPKAFELIATWRDRLSEAYGRTPPSEREGAPEPKDDLGQIIRDMNDEELEDLVGGP